MCNYFGNFEKDFLNERKKSSYKVNEVTLKTLQS